MSVCAIDWGDVATWVSGAATLLAVVVALVFSLRSERRQAELEVARLYGWVSRRETADGDVWYLILSNQTEYPIYRWQATIYMPAGESLSATDAVDHNDMGVLPPGTHEFLWTPPVTLPDSDAHLAVKLLFKDGAGETRQRASDGSMKVVANPEWLG